MDILCNGIFSLHRLWFRRKGSAYRSMTSCVTLSGSDPALAYEGHLTSEVTRSVGGNRL